MPRGANIDSKTGDRRRKVAFWGKLGEFCDTVLTFISRFIDGLKSIPKPCSPNRSVDDTVPYRNYQELSVSADTGMQYPWSATTSEAAPAERGRGYKGCLPFAWANRSIHGLGIW